MKLFEKILTVFMAATVILMFVKFVAPIPALLIFKLSIITLIGVIVKVLDEPKKMFHHLLIWIFITSVWCFIANQEINDAKKVKEKEPIEIIYRT